MSRLYLKTFKPEMAQISNSPMQTQLEDEWDKFFNDEDDIELDEIPLNASSCDNSTDNERTTPVFNIPECGPLKISTKTKIVYMNKSFDLKDVFWRIPLIDYMELREGIIKKQIKYNFENAEEVARIEQIMENESKLVRCKILNQINNPTGRVQFKDIRKISVGIDKNDMSLKKTGSKSAFYNCFVLILRIKFENKFKEIHVKIFNTGKLEIPGIQNDEVLDITLNKLSEIMNDIFDEEIMIQRENEETVLINSNFTCNFFIDRERLYNILKYEYQIKCNYDPCSYPGILCRKYKHKEYLISFMIFRTGSVLIVGKCEMCIINEIYEILKSIFHKEYQHIVIHAPKDENNNKTKTKTTHKKKKKTIYVKNTDVSS